MKKQEFIKKVYSKLEGDVNLGDIELCLDAFFDVLTDCLIEGDSYNHARFGTFKTVMRAARSGRVPSTNERLHIPPKKAFKFVASSFLKKGIETGERDM